ncbi:arylesterase [Chitinophagaceae bacterium LB-8]|uniref:Arylesterase n=1 Tax=Paraflavisolibacter caeni TaxID=2982496 RepID=A0A9X3BHP6_9BACT|nr:arylesterase [Paraflavisolibacter caeni]MCU7548963.1 arylesterase [Paraflavisolibacter caeni]
MYKINVLGLFFMWLVMAASCGGKEKTASESKKTVPVSIGSSNLKTILFFGNSLTAGYGVEPSQSFPALIQDKIDSLQLSYKVINAGVSGETSAGGNSRIDWILKQPVDVFVLELGANDGLRGVPVDETQRNLQSIIDKVKAKYPDAKLVLAGMQVPPNMGQKYASDFQSIFPVLAKKNGMALIPFLLEKVGGEAKLNQEDGIHPSPEGHRILAENVWSVLEKEL